MKALKAIAIFSTLVTLAMLFACQPEINSNESGEGGIGGGEDNSVHVTGITLDRLSANILEGGSLTLVATVKPDNAENKNVSWSSSESSVASVDNDGKVTGIKAGSATVTAKTEDGGKTASCVITVEPNEAPSITLGAENISAISVVLKGKANLKSSASSDLKIGFQYSKSAGILPTNSTTIDAEDADANYIYTTCLTGLEPGTTYYFRSLVRQNGQDEYGETKEFKTKDVSSVIQIQDAAAISAVSAKLSANLTLTDVQYTSKSFGFYWGTSAESLVSKVTASEGNDAISTDLSKLNPSKQYYFQAFASFDGKELKGAVKSFTTKNIESILETRDASGIEATTATLNAKLDLTDVKYDSIIYGFYWSTSESSQDNYMKGGDIADNAFVATMSNLPHKTQYWYKAYVKLDYQTFFGSVKTFTTDLVKVESVSLDRNEFTFNTIGNTLTLTRTVLPADATDKRVEWSSSNEDVATVDQNGIVTAKGNGTATITVTTKDQGKTASCTVKVRQHVTKIALNKSSLSLMPGESYTLVATVSPANAFDKTLTWISSDTSVAMVDADGAVTASEFGKTTITVSANDGSGKQATCSVWVRNPCPSGAVDLGLSVYWATSNLSTRGLCSAPQNYGDYYAWGEKSPKDNYNWSTYIWCNGNYNNLTKYNTSSDYGPVDNKTVLNSEDDVAHVVLGGNWRMPTDAEWAELINNCTWKWTSNYMADVSGYIVTSNKTGYTKKSIFLPAAGYTGGTNIYDANSFGYYWSSSLRTEYPYQANFLDFYSSSMAVIGYDRSPGYSVRPVSD